MTRGLNAEAHASAVSTLERIHRMAEREFCERYSFSRTKFFQMKLRGTAPRMVKFGSKLYVTAADEADWFKNVFSKSIAPPPYAGKKPDDIPDHPRRLIAQRQKAALKRRASKRAGAK